MLPRMRNLGNQAKRQVVAFQGLNLRDGAQEGQLRFAENLSTAAFPALAARKSRKLYSATDAGEAVRSVTAVFGWDKLVEVDGTRLLLDGQPVGQVTAGEKQFAVVNTKLCIWPDRKCLDLVSKKFYNLQAALTTALNQTVAFSADSISFQTYASYGTIQSNNHYFIITRQNDGRFLENRTFCKICDSASFNWETKKWDKVNEREVEIDAANIHAGDVIIPQKSQIAGSFELNTKFTEEFRGEPVVVISPYGEENDGGFHGIVRSVSTEVVDGWTFGTRTNLSFEVFNRSDEVPNAASRFSVGDFVTVEGAKVEANNVPHKKIKAISDTMNQSVITFETSPFTSGSQTEQVTLTRKIPDMDYICESKNRLWGVSNSTKSKIWDADKKEFKESNSRVLYVSALGEPTCFYDFSGVDTDSFQVAVASKGDFTGIVNYSTSVLCMKENQIYKVFGDYPSNFQMFDYDVPGCAKNAHKSMRIIDEVLYYAGKFGIYAYTGATPELVSYALGDLLVRGAAAGADAQRYYLAMDAGGGKQLYVYDTRHRLWMREDALAAVDFAEVDGALYAADGSHVWVLNGADGAEAVSWAAEFCPLDAQELAKKDYRRLWLRAEMAVGATICVEVWDGAWRAVFSGSGAGLKTIVIPIGPNRKDALQLRMSGTGMVKLHNFTREYIAGGS